MTQEKTWREIMPAPFERWNSKAAQKRADDWEKIAVNSEKEEAYKRAEIVALREILTQPYAPEILAQAREALPLFEEEAAMLGRVSQRTRERVADEIARAELERAREDEQIAEFWALPVMARWKIVRAQEIAWQEGERATKTAQRKT